MLKSVGGASGSSIDAPTSGTVAATIEGVDAAVTTVDWTLFEGLVTLKFRDVTFGASNSNELSIPGGTFPVQLRPTHAAVMSCSLISGGAIRTGHATAASAGAGGAGGLFFDFPNDVGNLGPTNFAPTGVKGFPLGLQLVYHV